MRFQECRSHCESGPEGTGPIGGHRRLEMGTKSGDKAGLLPSPLMSLFWSQVQDLSLATGSTLPGFDAHTGITRPASGIPLENRRK